jgi:hypothetical protein
MTGAGSTTTSSDPTSTRTGRKLHVSGLVISAYARHGHQTLSFDAYLKFIEDDLLAAAPPSARTLPTRRPPSRLQLRQATSVAAAAANRQPTVACIAAAANSRFAAAMPFVDVATWAVAVAWKARAARVCCDTKERGPPWGRLFDSPAAP